MATVVFRGDAQATAQVDTITIGGTWANGETATVTINGKTVTHTAVTGSLTVNEIAAALRTALNASDIGEFSEITFGGTDPDITCTADTPGAPFTMSVSKVSTSGTISKASTTANSGPSVLQDDNVTGGSLPGTGDTWTLEDSAVSILYDLDQLPAGTIDATYIEASYTGSIGNPRFNPNGYHEYRPRELEIETSVLEIGRGDGDGSPRMLINLGSVACDVRVYKTDASSDDGYHALRIRGTNAANTMEVNGSATVDIAPEAGQVATFATLYCNGACTVRISNGVTVGTLVAAGNAQVEIESAAALAAITEIRCEGQATVVLLGDNAVTAINVFDSATLDDRGEGTVTTLTKGPDANYTTANSSVNAGARTITNTVLAAGGGTFNDGQKKVTFTNPIDLGAAGISDLPNLNLGDNINLQRS